MELVRELLQPLFTKPVLKDQLLSKPPFRFVHDVVSGVIKATEFGMGLYDDRPDLQDAKGIKEKQAKIDFIDRIVLCVGNFQGFPCDLKAGKVVAGLEPEKTNKFFIALGQAAKASSADSSSAAVRRTLANEQPDPAFANGGNGGGGGGGMDAKDDGGDAKAEGMDAKGGDDGGGPGPGSSQAKPPPSRGGGQRNAAGAKEDVPPRAGGAEVMGHDENTPSYETFIEQCNGEIQTTITMMGDLIAKPKMSEKLLSKPPFRFLHDVMMAVTDATGFGTDLFDDSEKDGKVLSKASKEEKVAFLEKVKQVVGFSLNTMVEARPAKIVAGLEPENTNRLLQLLAVAAKQCPNSAKAVAMVRGGGVGPGTAAVDPTPNVTAPQSRGAEEPAVAASKEPVAPAKEDSGAKETVATQDTGGSGDSMGGAGAKGDDEAKDAEDNGEQFGEAEPKRSMRPTTARRRPPRVKENVQQVDQPGGGGDAKSLGGGGNAVHIIADGADDLDSDEEADAKASDLGGFGVVADMAEGASNLVREIENEARAGNRESKNENDESKTDNGKQGIRLGKIKKSTDQASKNKKSMSSWSEQDIDQLRVSVQRLCQSTNPLGKCMDFVHEDLTAMSKEYERWQTE